MFMSMILVSNNNNNNNNNSYYCTCAPCSNSYKVYADIREVPQGGAWNDSGIVDDDILATSSKTLDRRKALSVCFWLRSCFRDFNYRYSAFLLLKLQQPSNAAPVKYRLHTGTDTVHLLPIPVTFTGATAVMSCNIYYWRRQKRNRHCGCRPPLCDCCKVHTFANNIILPHLPKLLKQHTEILTEK